MDRIDVLLPLVIALMFTIILELQTIRSRGYDSKIQHLQESLEDAHNKLGALCKHFIPPQDCVDVAACGHTKSGVYSIYPTTGRPAWSVYCDMQTGEGGWLVFQRRQDGSVDFNRGWNDYRDGFGNVSGEYWLGNEVLALLTNNEKRYILRVDLGDWEDQTAYAEYDYFKVSSETNKFMLTVGSYNGSAGNSLSQNSNTYFSTSDRDNDSYENVNCAERYESGWWFERCGFTNLNYPYQRDGRTKDSRKGIFWNDWHGRSYSLKFVELKIRPRNNRAKK